ncbi:PH domain-containing protein [Marinactinospora rubrisoli]|uniref:PH domain-containing protein n=1 Tax=Marinactinospora rubrisoli TaxID=2715399 RepID=A0ABW2KP90_9ACTN
MNLTSPTPPPGADGLRLRPPRYRVDRRAIAWWTGRALLWAAPPAVALAVTAVFAEPARSWLWPAAAGAAVLGAAYTLVMPQWRYRVHRWETTDDAVYTAAGWLWQEWRVAPMSRIQSVDTTRGPLQRLFGLSTVTVTTASAAGALAIGGLDHERAAALADRLTATTQATPGDAT